MNTVKLKCPHSIRRLTWIAIPILLMIAIAAGSITVFKAGAASPLNGHYNFRGITTAGPSAGLYITGALSITVDGSGNIKGNICGLKISEQSCTVVTGSTPDNVHVSLVFRHLKGFPVVVCGTDAPQTTAQVLKGTVGNTAGSMRPTSKEI